MRVAIFGIVMSLASPAWGTLSIMSVGDSVGAESVHRATLSELLTSDGVCHEFVGDRADSTGGYQAWGGMRFSHMLDGWIIDRGNGPTFEAGVRDALAVHDPNVFLVLGGYNNMIKESVGDLSETISEYTALIDFLVATRPNASILVSNITDFDPSKEWGHKRQNVFDFNIFLWTDTVSRQSHGENVLLVNNFSSVTHADLGDDGLHVRSSGLAKIGANWHQTISVEDVQPQECPVPTECEDGEDNDGDGRIDFDSATRADPNFVAGMGDPSCWGAHVASEVSPCQDGIDNDGDARMDFDGGASLDLDDDGFVDAQFNPAQPAVTGSDFECVSPWGNKEGDSCGLGFELALLMPLLMRLHRRRQH